MKWIKNFIELKKPLRIKIPVEIKYGKIKLEGVTKFMEKFKVNKGYIISYDKEEKHEINGKTIIITPAYKFLLMLIEFQNRNFI